MELKCVPVCVNMVAATSGVLAVLIHNLGCLYSVQT